MKTKEYRKNYNNEYQKENIKRFTFKLNKKTDDPELLEIWDQIENKSKFIKSALYMLGDIWLKEYDQYLDPYDKLVIINPEYVAEKYSKKRR